MERFDLYGEDGRRIGRTVPRGEPIPRGTYHLVVQTIVINSSGEILLTQRVPEKTSGGKWEGSGGCVIAGEYATHAAARELYEETGISAYPSQFIHIWDMRTEDMIRKFYAIGRDAPLRRLRLQKEEVCAAKWVDIDRFEQIVRSGETTRSFAHFAELNGGTIRRLVRSEQHTRQGRYRFG